MVASFEPPSGQTTIAKHRTPAPAFPLSSPHHDNLTRFKPVNGVGTLAAKDVFFSPNPFASSSSEDDSGSSSGQDEFHLERYSQETNRTTKAAGMNRRQSRRRNQQHPGQSAADKKARPGLNIVTNFSTKAKRSNTDGLILDQVQSQRPRLGPRYATSIKSAKAEHMNHPLIEPLPRAGVDGDSVDKERVSKRAIARQAVSKLQESQAARTRAAEVSKTTDPKFAGEQTHQDDHKVQLRNPVSATSGYSPGARSIVIGMSIPEHEVDAHRSVGGGNNVHSADTPNTPAIVITPADEADFGNPAVSKEYSKVYSPHARTGFQMQPSDLPSVPGIPARFGRYGSEGRPVAGASIIRSENESDLSRRGRFDESEEIDHHSLGDEPRVSTDSQERILPSDLENNRHQSQGWWNLMLSPLLSRKGTVVEKGTERSPETPPVPSIPADIRLSKSDVVSPLTSESPETPRRAGLASARASVWSRWTTWERQRDEGKRIDPTDDRKDDVGQRRDLIQDWDQVPPFPLVDYGKGLAAEYYHACAVEQLTGKAYFECENHSCAERLPQLQSVFDKAVSTGTPLDASKTLGGDVEEDAKGAPTSSLTLDRKISSPQEPEELSPNVRQANTATVVRARAVETPELTQESQGEQTEAPNGPADADTVTETLSAPNTKTPPREPQYPNIATIASSNLQPPILSPGPVSPAMQHTMASQGAVPMAEIDHQPNQPRLLEQSTTSTDRQAFGATQPPAVTIHNHAFYSDRSASENNAAVEQARKEAMERLESAHVDGEVDQAPKKAREEPPVTRDPEPEEKQERKSLWSRFKSLLPKKKAEETVAPDKKKKRRWTLIISVVLFLIVLACILLATLLTRTGDGTPVQSQWLNLTGYPPIPTGISTIARPDVVKQQSKCVAPNTMWSCALPKEDQFEVAPNSPDQPNFRFQITFRNGTVPANMSVPAPDLKKRSMVTLTERANDPFTNELFTPNPTPPSRADQIFVGNTTDNITQPFEGEPTPFFISFIPVFPIDPSNTTAGISESTASTVRKRQSNNSADDIIPGPDVLDDGSAAPANLLPTEPYPTSQPIKLYNRGQADEHYGFYLYYDKSIFLHSTAPLNTSQFADNGGIDSLDANGGSTRDQSQLRCTFSQTRFLVRMWTNPAFGATLLPRIADNGSNDTNAGDNNSATDFSRPGSFPYPTTISIDRHGGNINKKAVYCYGVNQLQVIQNDIKTVVPEFRGVEGTLINAAPALVNGTAGDDNGFDQGAGGIDGGTGGCECIWQNWT
ncbi:hypothetical protein A1O7_06771 [Cladophialophora yegresii CBS 114405]|uniref:Uncharacterized protein n=1 Tax=Cladophialophora yegresii CBS 114405 TaxID=1182544 RepID=W9VLP6_9EURO|nr:uncharacterized protein A1O7_06771 [Cladophialophora yegresii CBS 114405]EXJ56428.1 hypothetical protein A1O7_06771 [Cladophialophora yegresii CBS 114405]